MERTAQNTSDKARKRRCTTEHTFLAILPVHIYLFHTTLDVFMTLYFETKLITGFLEFLL